MQQILNVEVGNYQVIISDENFTKLIENIDKLTFGQKRLFVFSQKVYKLYKSILNIDPQQVLVLKDGEKEKNLKNYTKILNHAAKLGLTRNDYIISVGGGVVGDLAGFAASTYMRGINYVQVPTTLLAMVDSSVGGKTAIDMFGIKNIVGSFYQPKQVYINTNFLKTLDKRQFMSGLAEVIKYAFIEDSCGYKNPLFFFEYLTLCCDKLMQKESITLMRVIEYCLNLKIAVVNKDEKESGLRKILNFGHTIGHAIESLGKYKKYTHGEAIIQGIFFILNYAYSEGIITYSYYRLSIELLNKYGFCSTKLKYSPEDLLEIMKKDKKATENKISFIVPCDKKKVKEIQLNTNDVLKML